MFLATGLKVSSSSLFILCSRRVRLAASHMPCNLLSSAPEATLSPCVINRAAGAAGGGATKAAAASAASRVGAFGLRFFFPPPRIRNVTSGLCDLVAVSVEEGTRSSGSGWSAGAVGFVGMLSRLGTRGVLTLPFDLRNVTRGPFLRDLLVEATTECGSTLAEPLRLPGDSYAGFI